MEEFLYKPIFSKTLGTNIIVYSIDDHSQKFMSVDGEIKELKYNSLYYIDLNQTMAMGIPVMSSVSLVETKEFFDLCNTIEVTSCIEELTDVSVMIVNELSDLNDTMQAYTQILGSIKTATKNEIDPKDPNERKSALVIHDQNQGLAQIVFKMFNGNLAKLKPEEIQKIGEVITTVIASHIETDVTIEKNIKNIKSELEYKIIEALPIQMRAGNIGLNMEAIINEIKEIQQNNEENLGDPDE